VVTASRKFHYGLKTDTGALRELNEDTCLAEPEFGLWLVADGMGGHRTGDVASQITRDTILERVRAGDGLRQAIQAAHEELLKVSKTREGSDGMGSTVVSARVNGAGYELAWVGDSRAYLYDGRLIQLTRDHSHVQDLLQAGAISENEAGNHPGRHLLTRCLGVNAEDTFEVAQREGRLLRGQELLLCSDGLTDELGDDEIATILGRRAPAQQRVDALVDAAVERGGRDNVTVVLLSAPSDAPSVGDWSRKLRDMALGAGLAAAMLGAAYFLSIRQGVL